HAAGAKPECVHGIGGRESADNAALARSPNDAERRPDTGREVRPGPLAFPVEAAALVHGIADLHPANVLAEAREKVLYKASEVLGIAEAFALCRLTLQRRPGPAQAGKQFHARCQGRNEPGEPGRVFRLVPVFENKAAAQMA